MKSKAIITREQKREYQEYVKRNFNLYAERIFLSWAMAMNDAGESGNKIGTIARKAYKLMVEVSERRVSWKDFRDVLKDENNIEFCFDNIKFNPIDAKRVLDIIQRYTDGYCTANECIEEIKHEVTQ